MKVKFLFLIALIYISIAIACFNSTNAVQPSSLSAYARRVFPVYSDPFGCSENQISYNMLTHDMLVCKNTGWKTVAFVGEGTGISNLNGLVATIQSFVTSAAGNDFSITSLGFTHSFNIPTASNINRGLLIPADWTTFNGKQAALGLSSKSGTGTTAIGTTLTGLTLNDCLKWDGANWINSATCGGGGTGDMILASIQTVTGAKTFNAGKLIIGSSTAPSVVANGLYRELADGKLYIGNPAGTAWDEIFEAGVSLVNLTSNVTGILPAANGGNGNGFFAVSGPATSVKTFTFPNASSTVLTTNALVTVAQGGTGLGTLTANNVILGNGTSTPNFVAPSTSGNILTSNGTTWTSAAPAGGGGNGYTIKFVTSANSSIADSSTYYIGDYIAGYGITLPEDAVQIPVVKAGTIKAVALLVYVDGTQASTENMSFYVRINKTTDATITTTAQINNVVNRITNTSMSTAVAVNDTVAIKMASPVLTTNPTAVTITGYIYIE